MQYFIIGVLSSVSATVLIYLARFQIGILLNLVFHRFFPNVAGKYVWSNIHDEDGGVDAYPNQKIYLHLKQVANMIKGRCEVFSGEELKKKYSVKGTISQTRILRLAFECERTEHHDFGVGLFRLDSEGTFFKGYTSSLCVMCQATTTCRTCLRKVGQET